MDNVVKKGILSISSINFLRLKQKKQWSKKYFVLFKKSNCGIQRLEMFANEKTFLKKSCSLLKIIPLNNCFRVVQMQQKHQVNVFEIHTKEMVCHFSANSFDEMNEWLNCLQNVAFELNFLKEIKIENQLDIKNENFLKKNSVVKNLNKNQENVLYCSLDQKINNYKVTIGITDAAIRCCLKTDSEPNKIDSETEKTFYFLIFDSVSVKLIENLSKPNIFLYEWFFRNIRRYGCTLNAFSFEAGRKCDSGPGLFIFYSKESTLIFHSLSEHVNELKKQSISENKIDLEIPKQILKNDIINNNLINNVNLNGIQNKVTEDEKTIKMVNLEFSNKAENSFNESLFKYKNEPKINCGINCGINSDKENFSFVSNQTENLLKNKKDINLIEHCSNPFLANHYETTFKPVESNDSLKLNLNSTNDKNKVLEDDYSDVVLLSSSIKNNETIKKDLKNNKCVSVSNLNQNSVEKKKLNKSMSQIDIECNKNEEIKLANKYVQPNLIIKPPRKSKLINDSKCDNLIKIEIKKALEEPIFESRQELFGYEIKEENHYEDLNEDENIYQVQLNNKKNLLTKSNNQEFIALEKTIKTLLNYEKNVKNEYKIKNDKTIETNESNVNELLKKILTNTNYNENELNYKKILLNLNKIDPEHYIQNECEYAKVMKKTIIEHI